MMALQVTGVCPLLQVFDMPESIAFYREVLGFEIIDSAPAGDDWDWSWLRLGDAELMLNTAYEEPHRPASRTLARFTAHSDTILFFQCPDVDAAYAELQGRGLDVEPPTVAHYGMKQLSVRDPDGYQLCFQWPAA